ncbi:hypothetical protein AVEN_32554-1 [Araneus ventricosus]|uniref:Uncharacterized protein n=1 Tax=Araneus ventricosus TaxID=182803 RepID=A0A4Y2L3I1_ARAVE|nr:hypothetical protein AVEN_32554-1 [Araneus ventricosus]
MVRCRIRAGRFRASKPDTTENPGVLHVKSYVVAQRHLAGVVWMFGCQLRRHRRRHILMKKFTILIIEFTAVLEENQVYRGGQLAPMQWTSGSQANFTLEESTPWLPIHPNYITRNVECKEEQLQLFRKLAELKKSEEALLTSYGSTETSLMHTLAVRFSTPFESEGVDYEWYQNPCGLVGARTVLGDVFLLANFGTESLGFNDDTFCQSGGSITSFIATEYMTKQIEIVLTTNNLQRNREVLRDLLLEPGEAIIGRFIT